jgi:sec-independent protein translocase protein TatB
MFDIGFFEICLLSLVALLVLGPERLPRAARTVGALVRRARQMVGGVRDQIDRELSMEDFRREMAEQRRQFEELQARIDRKDRGEGEDSNRDSSGRHES